MFLINNFLLNFTVSFYILFPYICPRNVQRTYEQWCKWSIELSRGLDNL